LNTHADNDLYLTNQTFFNTLQNHIGPYERVKETITLLPILSSYLEYRTLIGATELSKVPYILRNVITSLANSL
jgi:hypothetical protein